jgi:hypothetical protein
MRQTRIKFYFAGKIYKNCWRHQLVTGLDHGPDGSPYAYEGHWPVFERVIFDRYDYVGPYFSGDDHGSGHKPNWHGAAGDEEVIDISGGHGVMEAACITAAEEIERRQGIVQRCLAAIRACDVVFAWIERPDAYGTLAELGYANAFNKRIWIACDAQAFKYVPDFRRDIWFVEQMAEGAITSPDPSIALRHFLFAHAHEGADGYVYLLRSGQHIKIGKSKQVDERLKQISPKTPLPVELLHYWPCDDMSATESYLHRLFAAYRSNGEWFTLSDRVIAALRSVAYVRKAELARTFPSYLAHLDEPGVLQ